MNNNRALLSLTTLATASESLEKLCQEGAKRPTIILVCIRSIQIIDSFQAHTKFVLIGTANGRVLVFDHYEHVLLTISPPACKIVMVLTQFFTCNVFF
jgi:hypothetical protein